MEYYYYYPRAMRNTEDLLLLLFYCCAASLSCRRAFNDFLSIILCSPDTFPEKNVREGGGDSITTNINYKFKVILSNIFFRIYNLLGRSWTTISVFMPGLIYYALYSVVEFKNRQKYYISERCQSHAQ